MENAMVFYDFGIRKKAPLCKGSCHEVTEGLANLFWIFFFLVNHTIPPSLQQKSLLLFGAEGIFSLSSLIKLLTSGKCHFGAGCRIGSVVICGDLVTEFLGNGSTANHNGHFVSDARFGCLDDNLFHFVHRGSE